MTNEINRESFLHVLQSCEPGLAQREIQEQSMSFVFKGGLVQSFNNELACSAPSPLGGVEGAVPAAKLLDLLAKLPEDVVEIEVTGSEFVISGKSGETKLRMESEVLLPVDHIEKPKKWIKLHADFCEAVGYVQHCAGTDESIFETVCVNVNPKWVEACDDTQLCRWPLETGFSEQVLVRASSVKHVKSLAASEFALSDGWVHFRRIASVNDDSKPIGYVTLACRRYADEYRDLTSFLDVKGSKATLAKSKGGVSLATELATLFSSENQNANRVLVELKKGKMRIIGEGSSGRFRSRALNVSYDGPPLKFLVAPDLFGDLVDRSPDCIISTNMVKVDTGKYQWIARLIPAETASLNGESNDVKQEEV